MVGGWRKERGREEGGGGGGGGEGEGERERERTIYVKSFKDVSNDQKSPLMIGNWALLTTWPIESPALISILLLKI